MRPLSLPFQTLRSTKGITGFALSLIIPSTAVLQKYVGTASVFTYIVIAYLFLLICRRYFFFKFATILTDKQILWLITATFLILLTLFFVIYPLANSGIIGGGSDRDEALNIAATELLHGNYPYYQRTYLGNPISPLPGAVLLAIPFVLLGNSAYQNVFWLFAFVLSMNLYMKNLRLSLLLLLTILVLSPVVLNEFLTGGDLLSNSIYVLLFIMWIVNAVTKSGHSDLWKFLFAILLGIALSSRSNFILLLPLVFSSMVGGSGWKSAIKYCMLTCAVLVLVTIPFYLYDPQVFSPFYITNKLEQFESVLPFAGIIVPLITCAIAIALSFGKANCKLHVLFRNCTIVLAFPVISGTILQSISAGQLKFEFSRFGTSFLFFGAAAFLPALIETTQAQLPDSKIRLH